MVGQRCTCQANSTGCWNLLSDDKTSPAKNEICWEISHLSRILFQIYVSGWIQNSICKTHQGKIQYAKQGEKVIFPFEFNRQLSFKCGCITLAATADNCPATKLASNIAPMRNRARLMLAALRASTYPQFQKCEGDAESRVQQPCHLSAHMHDPNVDV